MEDHSTLSSSAKADDPVITDGEAFTGSSAFADDDNGKVGLYIPLARPRPGFWRFRCGENSTK
jgi:hypothetical protein